MPTLAALSRAARLVALLVALLPTGDLAAQATTPSGLPDISAERVPYANVDPREQEVVRQLLESPAWPFRVFGLLRVERYSGDAVKTFIERAVRDEAWQVRAFAARASARTEVEISPELLAKEREPRVVRAALRAGIELPSSGVERGALHLMRTGAPDDLLLGLEIAAASSSTELRAEAARRIVQAIRGMNDASAVMVSRRLAALLDVSPAPQTAMEWNAWLSNHQAGFPPVERVRQRFTNRGRSIVAQMDLDTLSRLRDYLNVLQQRDLELAIVMDSTSSMLPMINEARVGVDEIILFLTDISGSMRLAFVAYRDHDNEPVWEGHPFTSEVDSIREFLFAVQITGGADLPEAVLDGLTACQELEWTAEAERQIVLVGDAPPHERDLYKVASLLENYRNNGFTIHAVHVPERRQLGDYNLRTGATFDDIARVGGGSKVTLTDVRELVPSIMRFTIAEGWWSVFDEFYALYLEVCR